MNDPIKIKIGKESVIDAPVKAEPSVSAEPGKTSVQQQAVNAALINTGKQMMMKGVKAYGDITGDYAAVDMVDTVLGIGADLVMLSLGPVGFIAVGAKHTTQVINQSVSLYNSNREIDRQRERMGVIIARGSRYGGE